MRALTNSVELMRIHQCLDFSIRLATRNFSLEPRGLTFFRIYGHLKNIDMSLRLSTIYLFPF